MKTIRLTQLPDTVPAAINDPASYFPEARCFRSIRRFDFRSISDDLPAWNTPEMPGAFLNCQRGRSLKLVLEFLQTWKHFRIRISVKISKKNHNIHESFSVCFSDDRALFCVSFLKYSYSGTAFFSGSSRIMAPIRSILLSSPRTIPTVNAPGNWL